MAEGKDVLFGNDTTEEVGARIQTRVGAVDNVQNAQTLGGQNQTAQGGETISPAGSNAQNLSHAVTTHGVKIKPVNIERVNQATQSLENGYARSDSTATDQRRQRVGKGKFGSGNTGEERVSNSLDKDAESVNVPTNQNIATTTPIRNVGARFMR